MPEPKESRCWDESAEPRSLEKALTRQRLVSVDGDPKNRSYINSSASISNLYNKEPLVGLVKLDRVLRLKLLVNQFTDHIQDIYIKHYDTYRFL